MIEFTKGEIGMIIGALHLYRMEYEIKDITEKTEYLKKLDNIIEKLINSVEIEKNQLTFFKIIDNVEKR